MRLDLREYLDASPETRPGAPTEPGWYVIQHCRGVELAWCDEFESWGAVRQSCIRHAPLRLAMPDHAADVAHSVLVDAAADTIADLRARIAELEARVPRPCMECDGRGRHNGRGAALDKCDACRGTGATWSAR